MKRNLPWILLGVSVSLNLFFFIGFGWGYITRHRAAPPTEQTPTQANQTPEAKPEIGRIELVAKQLELTPQQQQQLEIIRQRGAKPMRQLALQRLIAQREIRAEWKKPKPDQAKLRELVQHHGQLVSEMRALAAEQFAEFATALNDKQREKWVQLVSHTEKSDSQ